MMNIFRADLYRIVRGVGLYVTFGIVLLLHFMVIGLQSVGGVNFGAVDELGIVIPEFGFDGLGSAELLYTRTDNLVFLLIPLILMASSHLFEHKTVKNALAWGASRTRLYLSKLVLALVLCAALLLFYISTGMLFATALHGFGGPVPDGYWLNLLQTLGAQFVLMSAFTCLGTFLMFMTKSPGAVIGALIAIALVPTTVITTLLMAGFDAIWLLDFDLMFGINRLGFINQLETRTILTFLAASTVYIAASTVGGIMLFRRADIK